MPWLEKGNENPSDNLLFVHVPRCGGTSLMKSHDVPHKATEGVSFMNRLGMGLFFQRYKLLESTNFPMWTNGNAVCVVIFCLGIYLRSSVGAFLMFGSFVMLIGLTFVFVAPTIARIPPIRRAYLLLVQYPMNRMMESIEYITGTNIHGYLPHLTAHKMLNYGYVTPEEMEAVSSMAIVRNPYSRMVSIYMYNRFGPYETFSHFMQGWYKALKNYRETGEMEEWYTHCHCIPQFEYTHFEGKQLVQSIVKQEELKYLKNKDTRDLAAKEDSTVLDLPDTVRDALLGMPHDNKRTTKKSWYDYYTQETLDMAYRMYKLDFDVFGYSPILSQRPDLKSPVPRAYTTTPKLPLQHPGLERMQRNSSSSSGTNQVERHSLIINSSVSNSKRSSMRLLFEAVLEDTEVIMAMKNADVQDNIIAGTVKKVS